jgi:hypothetical protein
MEKEQAEKEKEKEKEKEREKEKEEKIAEYMAKIEAMEVKREETAKSFDLRELARSTREIRTVKHPRLGTIRFGVLTARDLLELAKTGTDEERIIMAVWRCLSKADPSIAKEDVADLPWDVMAELLKITGLAGFFATMP